MGKFFKQIRSKLANISKNLSVEDRDSNEKRVNGYVVNPAGKASGETQANKSQAPKQSYNINPKLNSTAKAFSILAPQKAENVKGKASDFGDNQQLYVRDFEKDLKSLYLLINDEHRKIKYVDASINILCSELSNNYKIENWRIILLKLIHLRLTGDQVVLDAGLYIPHLLDQECWVGSDIKFPVLPSALSTLLDSRMLQMEKMHQLLIFQYECDLDFYEKFKDGLSAVDITAQESPDLIQIIWEIMDAAVGQNGAEMEEKLSLSDFISEVLMTLPASLKKHARGYDTRNPSQQRKEINESGSDVIPLDQFNCSPLKRKAIERAHALLRNRDEEVNVLRKLIKNEELPVENLLSDPLFWESIDKREEVIEVRQALTNNWLLIEAQLPIEHAQLNATLPIEGMLAGDIYDLLDTVKVC